jgi:hypothetical protein
MRPKNGDLKISHFTRQGQEIRYLIVYKTVAGNMISRLLRKHKKYGTSTAERELKEIMKNLRRGKCVLTV